MQAVEEIQKLLGELYDLVSGPEGFERDWKRLSALFTPYAKMIRTSIDANGNPQALVMSIQDYPANFQKLMDGRAFYEQEINNIIEVFGNIAHAFSTYEAWGDGDKEKFLKRGINSIQLYNDGQSWKVANMIWDDERPGLSMSPRYNPVGETEGTGINQ
ncbi:hypothetical protein [Microbulbifer taiwanensis]|uniref:Nuclear transport factor 2 family protein n=1 Tax=Microbulbifer taiwanensis TaxID=986746 RepID=A0ABW1YLQ7_9GAMM|nr:hypothetical protein [Microbulbifer taiwanensis]